MGPQVIVPEVIAEPITLQRLANLRVTGVHVARTPHLRRYAASFDWSFEFLSYFFLERAEALEPA